MHRTETTGVAAAERELAAATAELDRLQLAHKVELPPAIWRAQQRRSRALFNLDRAKDAAKQQEETNNAR